MYGANEAAIDGDPQTDVRYIRITDIDTDGNLQNEDWKTAKRIDEKYSLDENDLLFARSGATAGKTFIYKKEYGKAIFAGYMIRFRFDETRVNPLFIFYYTLLNRYRSWVRTIQRPSGQPNINSKEFKSFEIPLPPLDIQNHIIELIQSADDQKRQKDQDADDLLDSIDDYVLAELGIKVPVVEEKKCFVVHANEMVGNRIDSHFHQPKYSDFKRALEAGRYRVVPLSSLITDLKNGVEIRTYSDHGYRYLRVSDLGQHGIENHDPRYVDVEEIPKKIKLTSDSFLISRSGSLGLVSAVEDEIREAILSSHIFKVVLNVNQILPKYLEAFFRSQTGQSQLFQNNNGGVVPEISQSALKSISVVVPPLDIQERIVDEVMRRQSQAAKLRQEAAEKWEAAKAQFEAQLLSGEVS